MSLDRATIERGPAVATFDGATFYSKSDITVTPVIDTIDILTSRFGRVDQRHRARRVTVEFELAGEWESLAVLFPYASTNIGTSVFGSSDKPLVINTVGGKKLTLPAAAITRMPSIMMSVGKTLLGTIQFTGILANDTEPDDEGSYFVSASESYPGDAGFSAAAIKTLAYSSAWGSTAPFDAFHTEAGWQIDFDLRLQEDTADGLGVIDMMFSSLSVSAKAIPVGPTQAELLAKLQMEAKLGASVATTDHLNISATGVYVRLYNAALRAGQFAHGPQTKTNREFEWIATRSITGGAPDPLFYVGTAAPA